MMWLFNESVDQIVGLVEDQAEQAGNYDGVRRVKVRHPNLHQRNHPKLKELQTILMIGGFGESVYLQTAIEESLSYRQINVHRPEQS